MKKNIKKKIPSEGLAYVYSTFSNTIITITDMEGNVLLASSGGQMGFKGSRKSTPFAAQSAATSVAKLAKERGLQRLNVKIKGPGFGKDSAIKALRTAGIEILTIEDLISVAHNGTRRPRPRRGS